MPVDWSRKRRDRAAEYLALAGKTLDANVRRAFVAMAQKWLDFSNETYGGAQQDAWIKRSYYIDVQKQIGREMRAHFALSLELPDRIRTLLMQLDERDVGDATDHH
jgi:hypothetical protein